MSLFLPVQLQSVLDVATGPVDTGSARQAEGEAENAAAAADTATGRAFEQEEKARISQQRIRAHNQEVGGKFFGKPSGWKNLGGGQYLGYTTLDHEGDLVPHGEGEQWFASGNYLCSVFHMAAAKGLTFWHFAEGSERAGVFDMKANVGCGVDRWPDGAMTAGNFEPGGIGMTLKLGSIFYPDGSVYRGYCDFNRGSNYWAPSGFGVWDSARGIAFLGYFEDGHLAGECVVMTQHGRVEAEADAGRLIVSSSDIRV